MRRLFVVMIVLLGLNADMLHSRGRKSSVSTTKRKKSGSERRTGGRGLGGRVPASHQYHVGAKGGCYYIDGKGKKQYVKRSKCE